MYFKKQMHIFSQSYLDIIKVFIYQMMHKRVALKECINLYEKSS
jgi:hypothetical protein